MTSLEHVLVKHALDRLPSWTADRDGDVAAVRGEAEAEEEEVEEVGVGVAITTTDDEEQDVNIGIAVEQDILRAEDKNESRSSHGSMDGSGSGNEEEEEGGQAQGSGCGSAVHPRRLSRGVSSVRHASRSRSRSLSDSNSHSRSQSLFHSHSRSQSSMRGPLEMESSVATSWTHADVEGGRAVGDSDSERQHGGEDPCRSSAEGLLEGHGITVQDKVPRDDTEVVSLSRMLSGKDGKESRDVSRKEKVLVMQEEDIGEGWHPLRYDGNVRSQEGGEGEGEGGKGQVEEDVGSVHPLESVHGASQSLEMNEKERWRTFGSTGRKPRHLRLEFKPPSPQPWDEVDPPTDNNETYTSDYYSTLNSKKFETLQKSRRRPLIPHSSYYFGPPPPDSAYGTAPVGQIGVHHPREIVRIERDYLGGELVQFSPIFPLELEGRVTPTQFHQTINDINEILISAYSIRHSFLDNFLAVMTLQLSTLVKTSHYTKEMRRLKRTFEELNTQVYNPVGLNILWPQKVAFLFLEVEYY